MYSPVKHLASRNPSTDLQPYATINLGHPSQVIRATATVAVAAVVVVVFSRKQIHTTIHMRNICRVFRCFVAATDIQAVSTVNDIEISRVVLFSHHKVYIVEQHRRIECNRNKIRHDDVVVESRSYGSSNSIL